MATMRQWKLVLMMSLFAHSLFLAAQQGRLSLTQRKEQFLAQRSSASRNLSASPAWMLAQARTHAAAMPTQANDAPFSLNHPWTPVGPPSMQTSAFGKISGRVTSLAVDPADASGNTLYVGTTGGGIWKSTNAAGSPEAVTFTPLTDTLPVFHSGNLASLSIGALTVQPGNTGVILAGTGDTNDAADSYYGTGILRSTDHGKTWSLIQASQDAYHGGIQNYSFFGEGFSGFAWSTLNPQLVVAAVSLTSASVAKSAIRQDSFAGLYYSLDAGQTWLLATIQDGEAQTLQSPIMLTSAGDPGNSATSITWNPVRHRFYAAIRYHGYYESTDGMTFTRLAHQPGGNLNATQCPANPASIGSSACPIFRGTITTQPVTGDMFALTVAASGAVPGVWQDQGLWQDICAANHNSCTTSQEVTFSSRIDDTPLEDGSGGVPQGDYNLTLAAVPSQQDTLLFVGTEDIFRCSLLNHCAWRNTTNINNRACAAAQVAPSQHAMETAFGANGLIYFGNDGGLWRTTDAVDQQQQRCSADDATHFQNLNGGLGSLAEVSVFSQNPGGENIFLAALGGFGTAAWQEGQETWTQVLDGEGDGNAMDPTNPQNWYATSSWPVSISFCPLGADCTPSTFQSEIGGSQVAHDDLGLVYPAPWILDPQNPENVILGTCRVWRGPATDSSAWSIDNAVSPMLDTVQNPFCDGNAEIRSLAASGSATDPPGTPETIYAGMAGAFDGGLSVPGHVYSAQIGGATTGMPVWKDLSRSPVLNSPNAGFNSGGFPISSIYVDPHYPSGSTAYVTVQGFNQNGLNSALVYWTRDGGASWYSVTANLPNAPANSVVVDPNNANIVYVALDTGVYVTTNINQCTDSSQECWSPLGTNLPNAPVTQLQVLNAGTSMLRAATYGRGLWQTPLLTAGTVPASATLLPSSLDFGTGQVNVASAAQELTLSNTGSFPLTVTSIAASGDFSQTNDCTAPMDPGANCNIRVTFTPSQSGSRQGALTVYGNLPGGQITASLTGTGTSAGDIVLLPSALSFGNVPVGETSTAQNITISNTGGVSVALGVMKVTGDFAISANTCGASLAPNYGCTVSITFKPTDSGPRTGIFTAQDAAGTQTVQLGGTGQAPPTAILSPASLNFATPQTAGTVSAQQQVKLTNNGDGSLTGIVVSTAGDFIALNNCGTSLLGHATCSISVSYAPTLIGPETGVLAVSTVLGTQKIPLSGTGVAPPGISITPASVNFGSQPVGIESQAQVLTLTNHGGFDLTGLTFAISGSDFALAGNDCPSGETLPANSTCHVNVVFTPSQAGQRNGTLTVQATNLTQPMISTVVGAGEDFTLQVDGASTAVKVTGQPASYAVKVTPVAGSIGTVYLSCAGAPQNATCTVNPAEASLATNGASISASVEVATGVSTATSQAASPFRRVLPGMAFAVFLPWIFLRRRAGLWRSFFIVAALVALLFPAACSVHATGGAATSPTDPTQPATPSGQYTLTVTASTSPVPGKGLEKQVQLSLTIE